MSPRARPVATPTDDGEAAGVRAQGVMVTGAPRSGTTWVGWLLALDPRFFYTHEPFNSEARECFHRVLGPPLQPYIRYLEPGSECPEVSRFLDFITGVSEELARVDRSGWTTQERALFRRFARDRGRGAAPLIKDPIGVLAHEWVHARYRLPVLVMARHPAEFARSMLRLGWKVGPEGFLSQPDFLATLPPEMVTEIEAAAEVDDPVRHAALMWKVVYHHVHQVAARNAGIRVFRHEELAVDAAGGFGEIARWLGLSPEPLLRRLEPYCSEANPVEPDDHWSILRNSRANRDRWRLYFDEHDQRTIREVVEPVSELYGYSFEAPEEERVVEPIVVPRAARGPATVSAPRRIASRGRRRPTEAFVVLGMHRSGTSAFAHLLHKCGAELPRTLMSPAPDNPSGFWESSVLVEIADRALAEHGMEWHSLGRVPRRWFDAEGGRRFAHDYREALAAEFPGGGTVLVKDPRLCRLVPLVRDAFEGLGVAPHFLLTFRNPWEVVASLQARNACSPERALMLWLEHTLVAERDTRGDRRAFASYERLLAGWRGVVEGMSERLGPSLFTLDEGGIAELDREITPERRNHALTECEGRVPAPLRRRAEVCLQAMQDLDAGREASALATLDRMRREVGRLERLVAPVARDLDALAQAERREREGVQEHLEHAERVIADLRDELDENRHRLEGLLDVEREEREAVQEHLSHAEGVIEDLHEQVAAQEARNRDLAEQVRLLDERWMAQEARNRDLAEQVRLLDERRLAGEARIAAREEELAAVWRSNSMRVTAPLRAAQRGASAARRGVRRGAGAILRRIYRVTPLPGRVREAVGRAMARRRRSAERLVVETERRDAGVETLDERGGESPRERLRRSSEEALEAFLDSGATLELPDPVAAPRLSVVLVLYNQAALTHACLQALSRSTFRDYEVVIVDNASTDRTRELLERVTPCTVVANEENRHFLRGSNQAVEHARGRYLLFLNNDTRVAPEAIERALSVFEQEERVGAVGGRLILPDGTLQEAGSIVWSDGSCLGYGRGGDPLDPRFTFRRDVDYCSGAFLITPRELFEELGGFDEAFAPAYYEETDYCLRLSEAGYRVVYEPGAVIQHFEFGSSAQEGATLQQRRNQERFAARHRERLAGHFPPDPAFVGRARSARRDAPKVLVIDDRFPHRRLGSGFPRANLLVREMVAAGCEVTIYATNQPRQRWEEVYSDLPPSVECVRGDREAALEAFLLQRSGSFDTVFVSRPHNMEAFQRSLSRHPDACGGARIAYDAEAIFGLRDMARRELGGGVAGERERAEVVTREVDLASMADVVLAVSELEAEHFRRLPGKEVLLLGHCLDPDPGAASFDERQGFLFVGAFHDDDDPNTDSMLWFVREVWPIIRRDPRMSDVTMKVVGKDPPARVRALARRPGVEVLGRVESVRPYYDAARVCVVPTRFAAGLPYKAHECAAAGVPMVTTDLIAGQLGWTHEGELLAATRTSPRSFAEECIRLYNQRPLWERLRSGALRRIEEECTMAATREALRRALFGPALFQDDGAAAGSAPIRHAPVEAVGARGPAPNA